MDGTYRPDRSPTPGRRPRRAGRSPRLLLGAVLGLLALAPLAAVPVGCGLGGGALGIAVLSVGVSLVFTGTSPGYALRDPGVTGGPTTIEDDITLDAATPGIERLLYLGGELQPPVTLEGRGTAAGGQATLQITLSLLRVDDATAVVLDQDQVTIGTTATPFTATLDFSVNAQTRSLPGDIVVLGIARTGNDVTLEAASLVARTSVFIGRDLQLTLVDTGGQQLTPSLREVPPSGSQAVTVGATPVVAQFALATLGGPVYNTAGTSTGSTAQPANLSYRIEGASRLSLLASTNGMIADFTLDLLPVDAQGNPTGPVFATAGPFTADANAQRIDATFNNVQPFVVVGNTVGNQAVPRIGLRITNGAGMRGTTVTFGFDASTNTGSSFIFLPRPRVLSDIGSAQQVQLSQP